MSTTEREALVGTPAIADLLGLTRRTVNLLATEQGLPHYLIKGRFYFRISEVEGWLEARHIGQAATG